MEVEQIRPANLVEKQQMYIDKDIAWLLGHSVEFVEVSCPCCSSTNSKHYCTKNRFTYKICEDCTTSYMSPRPSEELLSQFYSNSANYGFWATEMFPKTEKDRIHIFENRASIVSKLLEEFHPISKSLLEIGPGYGTFCRIFREYNPLISLKGVEPSHELANVCRKDGIDVVETTVEKYAANTSDDYDVIVSFEVVEHLFDPFSMLQSIHKILNEKGILIFSCPNGQGFDVQVLKEASETIDHEHLNYLNPDSVYQLLSRAGFDTLRVETPGELDVSIVRREWEKNPSIFDNNLFLKLYFTSQTKECDVYFQSFLKNSNLSSNMLVVAIKK